MQTSSAAAATPSRQALINKQILKLETMMTDLWIVAGSHIANFELVQPKCFISLECDIEANSFDCNDDDIDLNDIVYEESAFNSTECVESDDD